VVISGGDTRGDAPNTGVNDANVYDPDARTLQPLDTGDMHYARWYATAVTLSNGKVALLGVVGSLVLSARLPYLRWPRGCAFKLC